MVFISKNIIFASLLVAGAVVSAAPVARVPRAQAGALTARSEVYAPRSGYVVRSDYTSRLLPRSTAESKPIVGDLDVILTTPRERAQLQGKTKEELMAILARTETEEAYIRAADVWNGLNDPGPYEKKLNNPHMVKWIQTQFQSAGGKEFRVFNTKLAQTLGSLSLFGMELRTAIERLGDTEKDQGLTPQPDQPEPSEKKGQALQSTSSTGSRQQQEEDQEPGVSASTSSGSNAPSLKSVVDVPSSPSDPSMLSSSSSSSRSKRTSESGGSQTNPPEKKKKSKKDWNCAGGKCVSM